MIGINKHSRFVPLCFGLVGLSACVLLAAPTASQNRHPAFPKIAPQGPPPPLRDHKYWTEQGKEFNALINQTWAFEQWTGDDAPYAAVRSQIEHAANAGQPPLSLVSQYAAQAKREPNNPLAQFAWAYTVRLADKALPTSKAMADLRFAAELAISEAPQPHTYNYDRLHYLIWILGGGGGPSYYLRDLTTRLLKKDPNDFPVLLGQALIYTQNREKAPKQHGYVLIQQMIKKYPNKPEVYDALACWYYTQYMFYHNPDNYQQAMKYYRKALEMYPVMSARRTDLPAVMSYLTMRYHQISGG